MMYNTREIAEMIIPNLDRYLVNHHDHFLFRRFSAPSKAVVILLKETILLLSGTTLENRAFCLLIYKIIQKEFDETSQLRKTITGTLSSNFCISPERFHQFISDEELYRETITNIKIYLVEYLRLAQSTQDESKEIIFARLLQLFPSPNSQFIDNHPSARLFFNGYFLPWLDFRQVNEIPLSNKGQSGRYLLSGVLSVVEAEKLILAAASSGKQGIVFFSLRSPIEPYDQSGKRTLSLVISQYNLDCIRQRLPIGPEFETKFTELPLDDHTPRDYYTGKVIATEILLPFIELIEQAIQDKDVHVSCWSGMERSVVITAIYLYLYHDMTIPDALDHIKQHRSIAKDLSQLEAPFTEFLSAFAGQVSPSNRPFP